MAAINWSLPTSSTLALDYSAALVARFHAVKALEYDAGDTNHATGAKRFNPSNEHLETYNGTSWVNSQPLLAAHLASVANPHAVTAAQVGAPTLAVYNAHVANVSNPHSVTAAQVGAPSIATLTAHTSNTSNPHATTAAQVGALSAVNNLSDVTNVTTARGNIGAASAATVSSHVANVSNPHATTAAQVGAFALANLFNEISAPYKASARANLNAAAAGVNVDITDLNNISAVTNDAPIGIGTTNASSIYITATTSGGARGVAVEGTTGNFLPFVSLANNCGDATHAWNTLYTQNISNVGATLLHILGRGGIVLGDDTADGVLVGSFGVYPYTHLSGTVGNNVRKWASMYAAVYNTFTGAHPVNSIAKDVKIGDAVAMTSDRHAVKLTRGNNNACLGLYLGCIDGQHLVAALGDTESEPLKGWPVCDESGHIGLGTKLVASEFPGVVKAFDPATDIGFDIVGRSFEDVVFDKNGRGIAYGVIYSG